MLREKGLETRGRKIDDRGRTTVKNQKAVLQWAVGGGQIKNRGQMADDRRRQTDDR